MTLKLLLLILSSVSLSALAQITLKTGMSTERIQQVMDGSGSTLELILSIAHSPLVWLGLGMYFIGALVWLLVLARVDVSFAYPFVGLGFILTMLLGFLLLGEVIGVARIIGTLLVVGGVVLISSY